jgi:Uma2 family endonuclease
MAITEREMTLEQFLALRERKPALEYEDGRITRKASPKGKHSTLQGTVVSLINEQARPPKNALAFPELRTTWNRRSYVPDVSVYRWARIPIDAAGEIENDFFEPPDVAVEILSPRQSVTKAFQRCLWYVTHGVAIALLVDPTDRSIFSFRPDRIPLSLVGSDRIDLDDVLPGFNLTVQALFDSLTVG